MKKKIIWLGLSFLVVVAMVLASCAKSTTTTTKKTTSTGPTTTSTGPTTTSTGPTTTSTGPTTTTPTITTTVTTGNWWDSLGKPQYGGEMVFAIYTNITSFDSMQGTMPTQIYDEYMEQPFATIWTVNPAEFSYQISFHSIDMATGWLLQSWEFTTPGVFIMHLRQGIHWQNIAPANGRELTADDIAFTYCRELGIGYGYTAPAAYIGTTSAWSPCTSVTATDKYTVVMKWNTPNPEVALENLLAPGGENAIVCPDAVKLWGDLSDWHHAIGTGPFILQDFVSGSSATFVKNPNYWGYDERYPQNQLPYVNGVKYLIIPDTATALAAFRTGKIDDYEAATYQQSQEIQKTNPETVQISYPLANTPTLNMRTDRPPFSDLRVREALQMAIDLPTIAKTYYAGTADPSPSTLTSNYLKGWGFPYSQWPQDLKDQYAYNPTGAKQLLAAAGYPNGFNTDIVTVPEADLDLLQIVKSYWAAIGVNLDIRIMDSASWNAFVLTKHLDDAINERQPGAGSLGLEYYVLRQIIKFQYGNSSNTAQVNDPVFNAFPAAANAATSTDQLRTIMTAANKYVAEQHFSISLLQPIFYDLCQPWLRGYAAQDGAISGSSGPMLACFYQARFWIDQNLKKSMGH